MPDETKAPAPKPAGPKAGDRLGTLNGVEVKFGADGKAVLPPAASKPATLAGWHDDFVARRPVTLVKKARKANGRTFPEARRTAMRAGARATVAARVLFGVSPAERDELTKAFEASKTPAEGDAFQMWALRQIDAVLPDALSATEPASQPLLLAFASPAKLAEFRAATIAAPAKPAP